MSAVGQLSRTAHCLTRELQSQRLPRQQSRRSLHRVRKTSLHHNLSCLHTYEIENKYTVDCVFVPADAVAASLLSDLSADLFGLEVESWSLAVGPDFCRQHDRRTVKRQDVIYGGTALLNTVFYIICCAYCVCNCKEDPIN